LVDVLTIMASFCIQKIDGDHFHIELAEEQATVRRVKDIICKQWLVPPLCQQLIIGSSILREDELIKACHLDGNEQTCVTMLVSFERVSSDLMQGGREAQKLACEALCELITDTAHSQLLMSHARDIIIGLFNEAQLNDAVSCTSFGLMHDSVKCEAVKALGVLSQHGDHDAISALCECVSDAGQSVRNAAVKTLRLLPQDHHTEALCILSSYLEHPQWQIRCAAVKGLDSFTKVGNEDATELVKPLTQDPDDSVRMVAVYAYHRLAQIGSERGSVAACNGIIF